MRKKRRNNENFEKNKCSTTPLSLRHTTNKQGTYVHIYPKVNSRLIHTWLSANFQHYTVVTWNKRKLYFKNTKNYRIYSEMGKLY
jgi:hypothetical protein